MGGADNNLYSAEALVRAGYPANRITDFLAANLAASQGGDGGWHLPGYSRSPLQDSDFSRTAMAMRALKTYGTPGRSAEMKQRLERGKQWLLHAQPVILEDMDMRLVGVAAAGASAGGTSQTGRADSGDCNARTAVGRNARDFRATPMPPA